MDGITTSSPKTSRLSNAIRRFDTILKEEVDPHDKLICFTLLDLQGVQRTWAKFSITKVYEVISEKG